MIKNTKGSAIIWAIATIMMIMVIIGAGLTMSYTYYKQAVINNNRQQAYISAKSVIVNMVENIAIASTSDIPNRYYTDLIPEVGNTISLDIQNFPSQLGEFKYAKMSRQLLKEKDKEKDILTIQVCVEYNGEQQEVDADLINTSVGKEAKWQLLKYYKGKASQNVNITKALELLHSSTPFNEICMNNPDWGKAQKALESNADSNIIKEINKENANWKLVRSNDSLRKYLYVSNGGWVKFDTSKATDKFLATFRTEAEKKSFLNSEYYIQPYFAQKGFSKVYIYAGSYNDLSFSGQWKYKLIFNQDDGHWYYFKNERQMTEFENKETDSIQQQEAYWEEFKKMFTDENRVD